MTRLNLVELLKGDITQLKVDAIVNAANSSLLGGGGVDRAIHRAAGEKLLLACEKLGGCSTGEAKITKGYDLPAKYVIHTVGPVYNGGNYNEDLLLANCYANSLDIAHKKKLKSIAFPAISTGVYRYPKKEAADIALSSIISFYERTESSIRIFIVTYEDDDFKIYKDKLLYILF